MNEQGAIRVAIVSATRTPIGAFGGGFTGVDAPTLAGTVIRAALKRARLSPGEVEEVIFGNVLQSGLGANPARHAAVSAGIPYEVPSFTVNKVCGSGLKAVALAADVIRAGQAEIVVAGGMENMSRAPYLLPDHRWGNKMGHGRIVDSLIQDALWDGFYDCHMGVTAENLARQYDVSREEQDRWAAQSQARHAAAQQEGKFTTEMTPVAVPQKRGEPLPIDRDEHPRPGTSLEALAKLRPAFDPKGTVTAGNASGVNDGAAALVLVNEGICEQRGIAPLAWVGSAVSVGVDPKFMGIGPAHAVRQLLTRSAFTLEEIDLLEINEAFAAQTLAVCRELDLDDQKLNVNGGAIAMGHPVGASGARILVTLLHEMQRRTSRRGIASLCIGGGMGIAMLLERT